MTLRRPITAVTLGIGITLAFHGVASAHSNSVVCIDQATSTYRITNDYPLSESFTSPQGPSGTVAAGNGSYTDVVYVGDSLQIDATWTDGFTETRIGTGDCTPEGGTTTTTELVTTTTEQETTTSTTQPATTAPTTSVPASTTTSNPSTTSPTTTLPSTTSTTESATTTTPPSIAPSTTSTEPAPSTAPSTSTMPSSPSTTLPPECSDNPNTPPDDCAPTLPATGGNAGWLIVPAFMMLLCGGVIVICGRRR